MTDPFHLDRFVVAQRDIYPEALAELRAGRKTTHWMWFVFPQIAGLGQSAMARRYAISGLAEAQAYLAHSVLGQRLIESADAVASHGDRSATAILGTIDAVKLRSSMTLFERAAEKGAAHDAAPFAALLVTCFDGIRDAETLARLERPDIPPVR